MKRSQELKIEEIGLALNLKQNSSMEKIPTNIISLDLALAGGIASSTICQIVGESGTGKTSIALQIALAFCKLNKKVLYIDAENRISDDKLNAFNLLGFNNNLFFYCNISTFSKVETVIDAYISTGEISLILVDSLPSLINEGYLNIKSSTSKKAGISISNNNSNYDSRPLGLFLKKYNSLANIMGFSMVLINQYRCKIDKRIGTLTARFGPKYLDNICSTIIKIKANSTSDYSKQLSSLKNCCIGEFEVIKSNCLSPKTIIPFCFEYGKGIKSIYDTVYYMIQQKEITKDGTYYEISRCSLKCNGLSNLVQKALPLIEQYYSKNKSKIIEFYQNMYSEKC